jgi:hypothetical protein
MSKRFVVKSNEEIAREMGVGHVQRTDFGWTVVDTTKNEIVGSGGGEPEDQLLVRDWAWVAEALNAVDDERAALASECFGKNGYSDTVKALREEVHALKSAPCQCWWCQYHDHPRGSNRGCEFAETIR